LFMFATSEEVDQLEDGARGGADSWWHVKVLS
jgi:hypothetical protein